MSAERDLVDAIIARVAAAAHTDTATVRTSFRPRPSELRYGIYVALRELGWSYNEIGLAFGQHRTSVFKAVRRRGNRADPLTNDAILLAREAVRALLLLGMEAHSGRGDARTGTSATPARDEARRA